MTSRVTRVAIVDDHPLARAGLRALVSDIDSVEVVAEAENGLEAMDVAVRMCPDIMLLDVEMPIMSGIDVMRELRAGQSPVHVIVISAFDYREYVYGVLNSGASGYLKKEEATTPILREAIKSVMDNRELWISPALATHLVRMQVKSLETKELLGSLTPREQDVLRLTAQGRCNEDIASELFVSSYTVRNHVDHIRQKLDVRTRAELIAWAWEHKVVSAH